MGPTSSTGRADALMPPRGKAVPAPTPETQPYWDGCATGELRIQRCVDCGRPYFYPRPICPSCGSGDVEWFAASGRATLHSYVINHRPAPGFEADVQLAYVAVAQRQWAAKNPRAMFRDVITVADVLASKIVAYPFHLLECCLVTDGGGALVVTSADRAAGFPKPPVHVLGTGEASETPMISQMIDFTESRMFRQAGRTAFAEAGITTADVNHLMIYDAFAHIPVYGLEALGFVKKGEAGPFIAEGNTEPGGFLPLNTNGGGLSYTHTGVLVLGRNPR